MKKYETDIQFLTMKLRTVSEERDFYRMKYETLLLLNETISPSASYDLDEGEESVDDNNDDEIEEKDNEEIDDKEEGGGNVFNSKNECDEIISKNEQSDAKEQREIVTKKRRRRSDSEDAKEEYMPSEKKMSKSIDTASTDELIDDCSDDVKGPKVVVEGTVLDNKKHSTSGSNDDDVVIINDDGDDEAKAENVYSKNADTANGVILVNDDDDDDDDDDEDDDVNEAAAANFDIDELIGRYISAAFHGHGIFYGVVLNYDEPFYRICYEDGDTEEMTLAEVKSRLVSSSDKLDKELKERIQQKVEEYQTKKVNEDEIIAQDESDDDDIGTITQEMKQELWSKYCKAVRNKDISVIAKCFHSIKQRAILDDLRKEEEIVNLSEGNGQENNESNDIVLRYFLKGEKMLAEWQSTEARLPGKVLDVYSRKWKAWYRVKVISSMSDEKIRLHYINWRSSHDDILSKREWNAAFVAPAHTMLTPEKSGDNYWTNNRTRTKINKVNKKRRKKQPKSKVQMSTLTARKSMMNS